MKKLIAIITSLCLLTGYPTDCIAEVVQVFEDAQYSLAEKEAAREYVTAQLEDLYNGLVDEGNPNSPFYE